jgi:hypothetical protein
MKKPHASKNGHIVFNEKRGQWSVRISLDGRSRCFQSPYRQDCERWLDDIKENGYHMTDPKWIRREIMKRGGTNPRQVPDFPFAFLTDENDLWSCKQNRLRILKRNKGIYYILTRNHANVSCTLDKLRFCIENNVSPLVLSKCKLSVDNGQLMDCTDYCQKQLRDRRNERISSHAEEYIETAERWCHYVLAFYRGDEEAVVELRKVLDRLRPLLTDYVHDVLRQHDENKVRYIVDEVMSETLLRTLERKAVIYSPYNYMQRLCRKFHDIIKDVGGKARLEEGNIRIIGGRNKDIMKQLYNI